MPDTPSQISVLFLTPWYPSPEDPMLGLFVAKHAKAVAQKARVMVLHIGPEPSLNQTYRKLFQQSENFSELQIRYKPSNIWLWGKIVNAWRWAHAWRSGLLMVSRRWGKADILHVNILTRTALVALFYKFRTKTPYIISEHWSRYLETNGTFKGLFRKWLTRLCIQQAAALTVVSDQLGQSMRKHGITQNYVVLGNVVDTRLFQIIPKTATLTLKTIVHISCFEEKSKNLTGLLKATKALSLLRNDFVLKMIGTGPDLDFARNYASQLGLGPGQVIFEGLKENEELATLLANADLSILLSHYETFGIVVYESLACGIPVVVSRTADFAKDIQAGFGFVVSSAYIQEQLQAIASILDHPHAFDPLQMRNYVLSQFSPEAIGCKTLAIYQRALNKTHSHD